MVTTIHYILSYAQCCAEHVTHTVVDTHCSIVQCHFVEDHLSSIPCQADEGINHILKYKLGYTFQTGPIPVPHPSSDSVWLKAGK